MVTKYTGSGRLREGGLSATNKQDFIAHVTGGDWRHVANHIDMQPQLSSPLNGSTVQSTLEAIGTQFLGHVNGTLLRHKADQIDMNPVLSNFPTAITVEEALQAISTTFVFAAACSTSDITLSGLQVIDGYSTTEGSIVLVTGQTNPYFNGLYASSSGAWTRSGSMPAGANASKTCIAVVFGTTNKGIWINQQELGSDVVGSFPLSWLDISSVYTTANGIALVGNVITGVHYDYVINSLQSLLAATTEGVGSSAVTRHLLPGSYLVTGNTGNPSLSGKISLDGYYFTVSSGVFVTITGTTYSEGFLNGNLIIDSGGFATLNNLSWFSNNVSSATISTKGLHTVLNGCTLAGGVQIIFHGGDLFCNGTQFGDGVFTEGAEHIYIDVNTIDSAGTYQGEIHLTDCKFYGGTSAVNTKLNSTYLLRNLDIQNTRFDTLSSYSIAVQRDTQNVTISNCTFIGSTQEIYFYSSTNLQNTNVLIKGCTFECTIAPVYIYPGITVQSILCKDNVLINSTNMVQSSNGPINPYDRDVYTGSNFGILKLSNNYSKAMNSGSGSMLPDLMPSVITGGGSTIANATNKKDVLDGYSVLKGVIGAGITSGISHEIEIAEQNVTAIGNSNAYVGPVVQGSFSLQINIPNTGSTGGFSDVTFTPFQLDVTHNLYLGTVDIWVWPRTQQSGLPFGGSRLGLGPTYCKLPFFCTKSAGFGIGSQIVGSFQAVAMSDFGDASVNWTWSGNSGINGTMGRGFTTPVGTHSSPAFIEGVSSSIVNGIPSITFQVVNWTASFSTYDIIDRWMLLKFDYTAIESDANE